MNRAARLDRRAGLGLALLAWAAFAPFIGLLWGLLRHGLPQLSVDYLVLPVANAGREGGVGPLILSTLMLLGTALAVSLPLGLGTALLVSEYAPAHTVTGRALRAALDVLSGVPSIVFGLFGMAFFSEALGLGWSIASGGLTLACMVLPLFVRTVEASLSGADPELRLGARSLGLGRLGFAVKVLLPEAGPAVAAGMILSIGRAMAETAAVMFTAGASVNWPGGLGDPGRALAYHVYLLSIEIPGGGNRAAAASTLLVLMLGSLSLATHHFVGRSTKARR